MPYAILVPSGAGGIASHTLSPHEEWTLEGFTVFVDGTARMSNYAMMMDAYDKAGGVIDRQVIGPLGDGGFVSANTGSEPFMLDFANAVDWPQKLAGLGAFITIRVAPVTLTANCTLAVYAYAPQGVVIDNPQDFLETAVVFTNLHLWVEDTHGMDLGKLSVENPILLGMAV
jgi:hypothetical protein